MRSPSRRGDSPREINEAESRVGCEGHETKNLSARRLGGTCRARAEIQNLSACLHSGLPRNFYVFDCLPGGSAERIDPGRRTKSFSIYRLLYLSMGIDAFPPAAAQIVQGRYMKRKARAGISRSRGSCFRRFLPRDLFISLWLFARVLAGTHRLGTENQNLSESID